MNIEPSNFVVRGKQELAVPKDAKELVFDALVLVAGSHLKVSLPESRTDLHIRCHRIFSIAEGATLEISSTNGPKGTDGKYILHDLIFFQEAKEKLKAHPSPPWIKRDKKKHDLYISMPGSFMNRQGPFPRSRVEFRTNPAKGGNGFDAPHLQIFASRVLLNSATIAVRGGNGGKGGKGSQGWKGKNGGGRWGGGGSNGEKGVVGAKGGDGGDGGAVTIWAGSISNSASPVVSNAVGGEYGKGGDGGEGGDPGNKRPKRSQKNVRGPKGPTGKKGAIGKAGRASIVIRTLADIDPASAASADLLMFTQTLTASLADYAEITPENAESVLVTLQSDTKYIATIKDHDKIAIENKN